MTCYYHIIASKTRLFMLYAVSAFFNNFLPTSFGGDVYKFFYLNAQYPKLNKEILSTIVLERGIGFLSLLAVNISFIIPFIKTVLLHPVFISLEVAIVCLALFLVIALIFSRKVIHLLKNVKLKFVLLEKFVNFLETSIRCRDRKTLLLSFCYSFLFIFIVAVGFFLLFAAFGRTVNFFYILFSCTASSIISLIPISLNSLGVTEGVLVFLFGVYGVAPELSLAVALLGRVLYILLSSTGGVLYLWMRVHDISSVSATRGLK